MSTPKQRRDEHLRKTAREGPRKRLIGALTGGPLGILLPAIGLLAWASANGGLAEWELEPRGGISALVTVLLMTAVGVGFPAGLFGAVLARRLRTSRKATWTEGATAFVGALLAGLLVALPIGWLLLRDT